MYIYLSFEDSTPSLFDLSLNLIHLEVFLNATVLTVKAHNFGTRPR